MMRTANPALNAKSASFNNHSGMCGAAGEAGRGNPVDGPASCEADVDFATTTFGMAAGENSADRDELGARLRPVGVWTQISSFFKSATPDDSCSWSG